MRCYVSGPMTGLPDMNFPAFHSAALELRRRGHDVVSPAETGLPWGLEWDEYLRHDIGLLCECDTIVLLQGWHRSKGSRLEHHIALELGMQVLTLAEALEEDIAA
jgi:hypothetical protein